jgi:predicted lipid-binding transport protein (Tim44 family)
VTPPPAKAPTQQATPAQNAQPAAAPASAGSRWGGILGGLALGGLLGYFLGQNGMLGGMMGMLLLAALVIGAVMLARAFMQRRSGESASQPMQLAGVGRDAFAVPPPSQAAAPGDAIPQVRPPSVPAGFDTAGFLRGARMNFMRLQLANDKRELDQIRELTTAEMFDELKREMQARADAQETNIMSVDADLLELATEEGKHWASVRFSGMEQEKPGAAPVGFEEVWNLVKPVDGSSGWLLAGIQQMH